jgi:energy-converting hydrogenase Eha subunit C
MVFLFAITLFLSSGLLFWVQPMVGKMVLPALGGTPAAWNTCMVFFQAGLLLGYAYAHLTAARLGTRGQMLVHLVLLLLPLLILPVTLQSESPPAEANAVVWLLGVLALSVGLPFVLVASSGPLLQRWFAGSADARARDPYFLYAASNLGSLLALVSYPVLIEPNLTLSEQSLTWTAGYATLAALVAVAGFIVRRPSPVPESIPARAPTGPTPIAPRPIWPARIRWLLLALVPSSLMLSVTTYLTTDLAAIPLLWIVPLALYLLTFVLAFARRQWLDRAAIARVMPATVLILVLMFLMEAVDPLLVVLLLHLAAFFVIALMCHGELAQSRPDAARLTEYYLWLAVGGVLGGVVNSLLAPLLFDRLLEYPLALFAACLLRPAPAGATPPAWSRWDFLAPAAIAGLTGALIAIGRSADLPAGPLAFAGMFGVPLVLCYVVQEHPRRFALALGAILVLSALYPGVHGQTDYRARSVFGAHRVTHDARFRYLVHGNTVHGEQRLTGTASARREPLAYYHRRGPFGSFHAAFQGDPRLNRVALVGLGTGALASYAEPDQHWTFFEIDSVVIHIARDSGLFTYLKTAAAKVDVLEGDGRLSLQRAGERFGVIVLDAFTSDAIPIHLLTREAFALYKSRLRENGLIVVHVSNRYIDLAPVLANVAAEGPRPMVCLSRKDLNSDKNEGQWAAHWIVLVENSADLKRFGPGWKTVTADATYPVWTDDFSNVFRVLRLAGDPASD